VTTFPPDFPIPTQGKTATEVRVEVKSVVDEVSWTVEWGKTAVEVEELRLEVLVRAVVDDRVDLFVEGVTLVVGTRVVVSSKAFRVPHSTVHDTSSTTLFTSTRTTSHELICECACHNGPSSFYG
jgi:hypothetical protein